MKKICIVHYNTPYALTCLIKSINLHVNDAYIYVFENSDKDKFINTFDNVKIFDNSEGEIINFEKILEQHPEHYKGTLNNYASFKHCISIQKCMELINDNFVLLDSDVLIKKDFSDLYQEDNIFVGDIHCMKRRINGVYENSKRVYPFICFINTNKCKEFGITYYNEKYMYGLTEDDDAYWDTGTYFYYQTKNLPHKIININDYIIHYGSASWSKCKNSNDLNEWLKNNIKLWDDSSVIVTITSWTKRITNIPTVLTSILKQTKKPKKIVLNLSTKEFLNKEKDIPQEVINFINENNIIEINWIEGKNTKQWKKIIPTMQKYPNDWIICIDDDRIYWNTFIEELWESHLKYPDNAITINKTYKVNGYLQHCGHGTLETARFYNYFNDIDVNYLIDNFVSSDTVYNYLLHKNKHKIISFNKTDKSKLYNDIEALRKTDKTCDRTIHHETFKHLENKYGVIQTLNNKTKQDYFLDEYNITNNKNKKEHKKTLEAIVNARQQIKRLKNKSDDRIINAIYDNR